MYVCDSSRAEGAGTRAADQGPGVGFGREVLPFLAFRRSCSLWGSGSCALEALQLAGATLRGCLVEPSNGIPGTAREGERERNRDEARLYVAMRT